MSSDLTLGWSAGIGLRKCIKNRISMFLDDMGVRYEIKEYRTWFHSDYRLHVWGTPRTLRAVEEGFHDYFERLDEIDKKD